jgi:DNA-binding beta-propeller fold protein YncE
VAGVVLVSGTVSLRPRVLLAILRGVVLSCAAFAVLAVASPLPSAWAAVGHEFQGAITETEPLTPLSEPVGLALDSSGNLFVADASGQAVDIFSGLGAFQPPPIDDASVGAQPFTGGPYVRSVAVDDLPGPNQGMVYVAESNHEFVDVFKPEGGGRYRLLQERKFGEFMYVAFDNSGGPNSGQLYLLHGFQGGRVELVGLKADGTLPEPGESPEPKPLEAPPGGVSFGGGNFYAGIAVGSAGKLYLANPASRAIDVYTPEGTSPAVLTEGPPGVGSFEPVAVAVDPSNGEVYAADEHNHVVDQFSGEGRYLGQLTRGQAGEALQSPLGVAVNASGGVYVSDSQAKAVDVYGPDILLPTVTTGAASEVGGSTATLNGTVNPEGLNVSDCHFDYGTTTAYGQTASCEQVVGSGGGDVSVTAKLAGLTAGSEYHFRLVACNSNGCAEGSDAGFSTPPAPAITGETVTNLMESSADLNASVNPGAQQLEDCHFEYGKGPYEHTVPCSPSAAQVPPDTQSHPISATIGELEHDHTYHWRVIATNAAGTTKSPDHTFIFPTSGRGPLPDNRAYEMVTPPQKNGALLGSVFGGLQAGRANDGSRLVLSTLQCFAGGSCPANRIVVGTPYAFTRTPEGWQTSSLAPLASEYKEDTAWIINANDGAGLFSMPTGIAGGDEFYVRAPTASFTRLGPVTSPLIRPESAAGAQGEPKQATADFRHVVYSEARSEWPFDESAQGTLYEYSGSAAQPALVGVSGKRGSTDLISRCETTLGNEQGEAGLAGDALSQDGRFVYFTAAPCEGGTGVNAESPVPAYELYARVNDEESVQISAHSTAACGAQCAASPAGDASFQGASSDGTKVLFTDTQRLTDAASSDSNPSDTARRCSLALGTGGCNLYEYDFARPPGNRLLTISAGDTSGHGPRVQGVLAIAPSGGAVYFVARGVLTQLPNGFGEVAQDGAENLYLFQPDEPRARFVTRLSDANAGAPGSDSTQWADGPQRANVTSDGRFLLFTSQRALTVDDSRPDGAAAQVFRYDALTGALVRVSIGENGFNDSGNQGVGDASIVPATQMAAYAGAATRDPSMSDDGSAMFFMSPIALTAQALNDVRIGTGPTGETEYAQNVYEYRDGHVYLISDGHDIGLEHVTACRSASDVCLLGTDVSGRDVFFTTSDQLLSQDTDTQLDVYDARACSPEDPCIATVSPSPAPCAGEACHGIPTQAPAMPAPGSAAFNGAGNIAPRPPVHVKRRSPTRAQRLKNALRRCRTKSNRPRRRRCEAAARRRYGAHAGRTKGTSPRRARV